MARVTAEDCLEHIGNHFKLVLVASHRARQLLAGSEPFSERGHDKATVLALREIAQNFVTEEILQKPIEQKDIVAEEELKDLLAETANEIDMSEQEIFADLEAAANIGSETETPIIEADSDDDANINLDTLQAAEEQEEEADADTLQVDDHDSMVAETIDEIEKRTDLALDQIDDNDDDSESNNGSEVALDPSPDDAKT